MKKVKKVIMPVAGFGTRFLPATKSQPKEMLTVIDKPVIQYLVEDAVSAGIEEVIFVTSRGKGAIENHFDHYFELEKTLIEKNKPELLEEVRKVESLADFAYVRQALPLGDGHAVNCASHLVFDEAVLVVFGDTLYDAEISPAQQVIDAYQKYGHTIIGLSEVNPDEVSQFGVIDGEDLGDGIYKITKFMEKPKKEEAPSNLVQVGINVITPEVFEILKDMKDGKSGEIRLADAYEIMLEKNIPLYGKKIEGEWLDTGNKLNFVKATLKVGLKHEELGEDFKKLIKEIAKDI